MKKIILNTLAISFMLLIFTSSCTKNSNDPEPTKTAILVANPWRESGVYFISSIPDTLMGYANTCTIFTYTEKDSLYTETAPTSYCRQTTVKGKWYLNKAQDSLIVVTPNFKNVLKIETLKAYTLKTTSNNSVSYDRKRVTTLVPYKK